MLLFEGALIIREVRRSKADYDVLSKFLLISMMLAFAEAQNLEGDWCVTDAGDDGICKPLRHCPGLVSETYVYNGGGSNTPNLCSDGEYGTIVCCKTNTETKTEPHAILQNHANPPQNLRPAPRLPQIPSSRPSSYGDFEDTVEVSAPDVTGLRMSERKCREYTKMIDDMRRRFGLEDSLSSDERCPYPAPANELIVGGELAANGQYPHMAALGYLKSSGLVEWQCGGSLISEAYVLTAAHCASNQFGRMIVVRLGVLSLKPSSFAAIRLSVDARSGSEGDYAVGEIIRHKDHNFSSLYNDIALIRLAKPVIEFSNSVRPACINTDPDVKGKASATGWGYTEYGGGPADNGEKLLRHVSLSLYERNFCNSLYAAETFKSSFSKGIVESMLCAGELAGGKDSCQGDSGGPLQVRDSNDPCLHSIIGVTSFGKFCGLANSLGVYTKVSHYIPWIEGIVWSKQNK